jgi:hypothetical protein
MCIQEEFIAICLERVILDDPIGVVNQELSRSRDKFLLSPFTLNNSQLSTITYLLLPASSSTFVLIAISLASRIHD